MMAICKERAPKADGQVEGDLLRVPVTVDEARVINVIHENITDSEATTSAPL